MQTAIYDLGHGWKATHDRGYSDDPRASVEQRCHPRSENLVIRHDDGRFIELGAESVATLRRIFAKAA